MCNNNYEDDLAKRQKEHLDQVANNQPKWNNQPCMHDACPSCIGTGIKLDGSMCIHSISCHCSKCSPYCNINIVTFSSTST